MSLENLKEYARRCATEPELRAAAKEIGMTDLDAHIRQAEGLGLDWTMDDLTAFQKETVDSGGDLVDLNEDDLEEIAGGVVTATAAVVGGLVAVGAGLGAGAVAGVVADSGW